MDKSFSHICSLCLLLLATIARAADFDPKPDRFSDSHLHGRHLAFQKLEVRDKIPLHSVILMPAALGKNYGRLILSFPRSDISDDFIRELFFNRNSTIRKLHTFAFPQMEPILKRDSLILIVHDGIVWHLRSDIKGIKGYNTFVNDDVVATVQSFRGEVLCSYEHSTIRTKLGGFYIRGAIVAGADDDDRVTYLPDGRIAVRKTVPSDARPRSYEPRVELDSAAPTVLEAK